MKKLGRLVFLLAACVLLLQAAAPDLKTPAVSVSREALQTRLVELERQREQAIANVNAISGAIQECQYWVAWLKEKEREAEARSAQEQK